LATFHQLRRFHPIRPGCECRRRTARAQHLDLLEEWRIGAQSGESEEEGKDFTDPFQEHPDFAIASVLH
jgi:hypothetical protein